MTTDLKDAPVFMKRAHFLKDDIRKHGCHAMSYSSNQKGMRFYRSRSFDGCVPYKRVWGMNFVLSNPLIARSKMLDAVLEYLQAHPKSVFCQIDYALALLLNDLGFHIYGFGVEHKLYLDNVKINWKVRRGIKRKMSKLLQKGFTVNTQMAHPEIIDQINSDWLKHKSRGRELAFLARPYEKLYEEGVLNFYLRDPEGLVVGFCRLDPVYRADGSGRIASYVLQHLRVSSRAPKEAADCLLGDVIVQLKKRGLQELSLGLAPLYKMEQYGFHSSKIVQKIMRFVSNTRSFYHFQDVGKHKDRFQTHKEQTFLALPKGFVGKELLGLFKVNQLI